MLPALFLSIIKTKTDFSLSSL